MSCGCTCFVCCSVGMLGLILCSLRWQIHPGDTITCEFDAEAGTLSYFVNGAAQGVCFSGLQGKELFPAIAFYRCVKQCRLCEGQDCCSLSLPTLCGLRLCFPGPSPLLPPMPLQLWTHSLHPLCDPRGWRGHWGCRCSRWC